MSRKHRTNIPRSVGNHVHVEDRIPDSFLDLRVDRLFVQPITLRPMVAWGESTSNLPEAFRAAAQLYEGRVGIQNTLLEVLTLPIVLIFIIGFVGTVIIALFLPLISLIQNLT